jgi:hydroxyacylglutathione hydrolase
MLRRTTRCSRRCTTNDDDARTEWASLRRLLDRLPDDATVWVGHDYGVRPSSAIGLECATNPFFRCPDLAAFIALKRDWPTVKQRLGLK